MTALEDTRPLAEITADLRADWRAIDLGDALRDLLNSQPDVELASIRITTRQATPADVEQVTVAGRVGLLVDGEPGCPSCHVHGQQPHTEYCQLVDQASQLTHAELYGPIAGIPVVVDPAMPKDTIRIVSASQISAQCDDPEPHKAHLRFDDSPHNVCPGRLVRS